MNEKKSIRTTLEKEGWTRRFVASEPRLSEAVEVYNRAGFEVCLQSLPTKEHKCKTYPGEEKSVQDGEECRVCYEGFEDQYKVIFTRPAQIEKESENDLLD